MEIAGHRIAGLGGTFESQVWLPGSPDTGIQNYGDFLERLALRPQHEDIVATKQQKEAQRYSVGVAEHVDFCYGAAATAA
ncbi:hypothetical protein Q5O_10660 [Pseudomonas putida JB]|nr:hypothetical protein Q5O_10660 [Pseudomonas putida JB]